MTQEHEQSQTTGRNPKISGIDYDVLVIGAGLSGLYQIYKLRGAGLSVLALEAGADIGGTWFWNRYPGARVDSPCYVYQYWFSRELHEEWAWSERFPGQGELERYIHFIADRCALRPHVRLNTRVTAAHYDERKACWRVVTDSGETLSARFLISCAGMLSAPLDGLFPGQSRFRGEIFHTARWPRDPVDLSGKRVGIIGNGASGIQVIQTIAPQVAQLKVFQRTPQYTIRINNPRYTDADRAAWRARYDALRERVHRTFAGFDFDFRGNYFDTPEEERRAVLEELWEDGSLAFWVGGYPEVLLDTRANADFSEFVRAKMRARIRKPEVAAKLIPTRYGFGTRRVPLESHYLEAFDMDHVELVDVAEAPIQSISERGVVTRTGEHPLDVLILATGFDASTGALTRIDIRGREGVRLADKWRQDIRTAMGLQVHGFPNLFMIGAPLAPSAAFCNMTTCLQQQVDWITDAIMYVMERGRRSMEATAEKEASWLAHHEELANATLVVKTDSWYTGANIAGKQRRLLTYVGGAHTYRQLCDEERAGGYPGFTFT
ncbi:acetone monooxygenase [Fontimonas thermophila]|uniref:Acetone monooxygenase n=1 Tax=Fontimonas thermophila TaxID=1076937 RepID=A0A1I2KNS7_9GAMM|nr:NAD(P)/FAD-dependent oxidoreductase [Fontimonas thermophila]SFF68008.1 acetone monooxygenase [Fontimonas thermophila]